MKIANLEFDRTQPESSRTRRLVTALVIFALTLVAYFPALRGGPLWDDDFHVTSPDLQSVDGLRRIWGELGATQQYYPLLHSAFWIENRLWGNAVLGYHLTNVLLHALAACLVVAVVRRLALPGAELAGLIFALHPVGVESVAWISEQKNTLSAVFYLGAALIYLRFDQTRQRSTYLGALGLFLLALLTKTVTATLPAALLVVFWWQRGRLDWRRDVGPLLPWLALGMTAGLFTAWVERTFIGAHGEAFGLGPLERGLLAGRVIWFYLGKLAWPAELMFMYPRWVVDATVWWQWLFPLGIAALLAAWWFAARSRRGLLAGFLIFAGTLFPVLGFVNVYPFIYSYVADHFQYLAQLGIIVPLAAGLTVAAQRLPSGAPWLAPLGSAVLLAALGARTWNQCGLYHDAATLYRTTLAQNPASWMAHDNLGVLLVKHPALVPEAIEHFRAAIRFNPRDVNGHNNLGHALAENPAQLAEAISEYETALRLDPDYGPAHNNLGVALSQIPGRLPEAITHFEAAVRLAPQLPDMQDNLGVALAKVPERASEATAHFEAAARLRPDSAAMRSNLGVALTKLPGRMPEAIRQLEEAVRLNPASAEMQGNLGVALASQPPRLPEAIVHFQAAVRLAPQSAAAHNNLGAALNQLPERLPEAIEHFATAVQLNPDFEEARANLGNALVRIPGRAPEAIEHFAAVVRLNPRSVEAHFALGILLAGTPGRGAEALAHFEAALRINPEFAPARAGIERLRAAGKE